MKNIAFFLFLSFNLCSNDGNAQRKVAPAELKEYITESGNNFSMIYTYTDWCAPCVKEFPIIINFCNENKIKLYVMVLSKDGNVDLVKFSEKFKKKYNYNDTLYNFKYFPELIKNVNKKSNYKNYQTFIKVLLEDKYNVDIVYGSNDLFLTDKKANIIYIPEILDYDRNFKEIKKIIEN